MYTNAIDLAVVVFFFGCSTTENLAVFIWEQLKVTLASQGELLYKVYVQETENNFFVYRGEWCSALYT